MEDTFFNNIGIRIQSARSSKNITQGQLAEMIDSDYRVISRIESGTQKCSVEYLVKIADALQVSVDSLLIDSLSFCGMTQEEPELYHLLGSCDKMERELIIRIAFTVKAVLDAYTIK